MNTVHDALYGLCVDNTVGHLSVRQLAVVAKLRGCDEGRDFGDLAHELAMPKPCMSRAVDRLSEMGLVAKREYRDDARRVRLALTAKGRKFGDKHLGAAHDDPPEGEG